MTATTDKTPNWAFRGWLATLGVITCMMMFVFTAHADYQRHVVAQFEAVEAAGRAAIAREYTEWSKARGSAMPVATTFLEVTEATSEVVAELVSFDFNVIEEAEVEGTERRCLAEAIYFEAGFEPVIGQMAVADVVLNRVKNPYYPDTVCGVVYQGSQRQTGCQFSFTCDGSLNRNRHKSTFDAAYKMAGAILAGVHMPVSNNATHYHANYVSPYWAPKLTKTAEIGQHRFYRLPDANTVSTTDAAQ